MAYVFRRTIGVAILGALVAAITIARPARCAAGECEDRCAAAYDQCAGSTAAGCQAGAALVDKVAEQLGSQIPIPGLGKLLGGAAAGLTQKDCLAKLQPCEEVRQGCIVECVAQAAQGQPGAVVPQRKVGTLRVFSDHPRTRVYINDQRMGTTEDDPEMPFLSPELTIGKYWIRLETTDGRWRWEGVKDLDEGNVNSIEGALVDTVAQRLTEIEESWRAVRTVDERRLVEAAIQAYGAFVEKYPDASDKCVLAHQRIAELTARQGSEDEATFSLIAGATSEGTRLALCRAYLEQFPNGRHRPEVQAIVDAAERAGEEPAAFAALQRERDPRRIVELGEGYLATYPAGAHRATVEAMISFAKDEVAAQRAQQQEKENRKAPMRTAGGVTLGLGLGSLVASGVLGGVAWKKYSNLSNQALCWKEDGKVYGSYKLWDDPSYVCAAELGARAEADKIQRLSLAADVLVGVGGALAITGIVLLVVGRRGAETPDATLVSVAPLSGDGAFVALGWSY